MRCIQSRNDNQRFVLIPILSTRLFHRVYGDVALCKEHGSLCHVFVLLQEGLEAILCKIKY